MTSYERRSGNNNAFPRRVKRNHFCYFASNDNPGEQTATRLTVLNAKDKDVFLPIEEVKAHFGDVRFVLPHCEELKKQAYCGTLSEPLPDKKYRGLLNEIAKAVI